jgi:hypothetical protein
MLAYVLPVIGGFYDKTILTQSIAQNAIQSGLTTF